MPDVHRPPARTDAVPAHTPGETADQEPPAYRLHRGDALEAYGSWPAPAAIISDGAYGVRGFHGDTTGAGGLPGWYRPHE